MSFYPTTTAARLKTQNRRYYYIRKLRRLAEGFAGFDLGLWRRFERPAIRAVARDFRVVGTELKHCEQLLQKCQAPQHGAAHCDGGY